MDWRKAVMWRKQSTEKGKDKEREEHGLEKRKKGQDVERSENAKGRNRVKK